VVVTSTSLAAFAATAGCSKETPMVAPKSHHATGLVKSFGPNKAYVNIAHDEIPGYMAAMTMSFEPQSATQFDVIAVGDRVVFDFVDQDDGRRVLSNIVKAQ
jgi:Cu/Ag efflux protein CusF